MDTIEVLIADGSKAILRYEHGTCVLCHWKGERQQHPRISTSNMIRTGTVIFFGLVELHVREILEIILG